MSNDARSRRLRTFGYVVLLITATSVIFWVARPVPGPAPSAVGPERDVLQRPGETPARTVGDAWRWEHVPAAARPDARSAGRAGRRAPFTAASVQRALQDVEIDEFGDLAVDHGAATKLRAAFAPLDAPLSDTELAALEETIRGALPGPPGEQVATIVGDFHRYSVELETLEAEPVDVMDLDAARMRYEDVVALRHFHFGHVTAERLFGTEQAYLRYMLESMRIESDTLLTDDDKARLQAELRARTPPGVLPDVDQPSEPDAGSGVLSSDG
jgi:hypothetical protein